MTTPTKHLGATASPSSEEEIARAIFDHSPTRLLKYDDEKTQPNPCFGFELAHRQARAVLALRPSQEGKTRFTIGNKSHSEEVDDLKDSAIARELSRPSQDLAGIPWQPSRANATKEHVVCDELVVGLIERFFEDGPTYAHCCGQRLGAYTGDEAAKSAVLTALKSPVVTVMQPAPSPASGETIETAKKFLETLDLYSKGEPHISSVQSVASVRILAADAAEIIRSLLAAALTPPAGRGEGWRLVPVEPTNEMLNAAFGCDPTPAADYQRYKLMIAAAPPPPAIEQKDLR